jgi:response regulator RpfG family c-di-GMP phosphodiesterase
VADTLDAITSDRPYRSAQPFEDGFKVIYSESGRLFDPQITGAFFSLPKETWRAIAMPQHQAGSLPSWLRNGSGVAPTPPLVFS